MVDEQVKFRQQSLRLLTPTGSVLDLKVRLKLSMQCENLLVQVSNINSRKMSMCCKEIRISSNNWILSTTCIQRIKLCKKHNFTDIAKVTFTVWQGRPTGDLCAAWGPRCHFMRPAIQCLECGLYMFSWVSA
jgi:hypothetical protein